MRKFKSDKRLNKITSVIKTRQHSLRVVLENIHDPHNVSAIFRSCDAVGVPKVSLLYNYEKFPKISKTSSSSANKWIEKEKYETVEECYSSLREQGFKIYASMLRKDAVNLFDIDLTEKAALVMGNEHRGVSEEAAEKADAVYFIPMTGMIQSLNVSVATAVSLYEAYRQRVRKGMYEKSELNDLEIENMIDEWCDK
ncbi:MAG: RNA methyltransferase [Ignavibacteriae bacterium]|nr:RNA methyltransferase [Ignavibacteriota bacterium]NOG97391.1 RNA methyltransferase [Ignavibacteriota bacterium]